MKSLTDADFDTELLSGTWLVMFWASWCGPCLNVDYLTSIELTTPSIKIGRVNIEENPELSTEYSVIVVPTYIVYKKGKSVKRLTGLQTEESLKEALKSS